MQKYWCEIMLKEHRRTVVFDLDDTLYDEADYVDSGKAAVAKLIWELYGTQVEPSVLADDDFLECACKSANIPPSVKSSLLWAYRLHAPSIQLRDGVVRLVERLKERGDVVCILTDGRSITQRLKILALKVEIEYVYVSEEVGAEKPSGIGFRAIEADFPAAEYFYVADNPKKDFIAPHELGWNTIGILPRANSIHVAGKLDNKEFMHPQQWVSSFAELSCVLIPD